MVVSAEEVVASEVGAEAIRFLAKRVSGRFVPLSFPGAAGSSGEEEEEVEKEEVEEVEEEEEEVEEEEVEEVEEEEVEDEEEAAAAASNSKEQSEAFFLAKRVRGRLFPPSFSERAAESDLVD